MLIQSYGDFLMVTWRVEVLIQAYGDFLMGTWRV